MSRRRASVRITRPQTQSSESKGSRNQHCHLRHYKSHGFDKNSEYAGRTVLNLHRQTSVDPNELLGRSPSFQNSTFRPPPKKTKKTGDETEDDNQAALLPNITDPFSAEPAESFWLGKGSLRGFLPRQTPPPAYDSVIHIFQESCTWLHCDKRQRIVHKSQNRLNVSKWKNINEGLVLIWQGSDLSCTDTHTLLSWVTLYNMVPLVNVNALTNNEQYIY